MEEVIKFENVWISASTQPKEKGEYLVSDGTSYTVAYFQNGSWGVTTYFWRDSDIKYWAEFKKLEQ